MVVDTFGQPRQHLASFLTHLPHPVHYKATTSWETTFTVISVALPSLLSGMSRVKSLDHL